MDILTMNGKRKGGEIQDDIRSARGKSGSSRRLGLQVTSQRLPRSVSSRWKRFGKLLICSQRSSLKVEDRAVGEKGHRGEEGREFPGCQTKPIEEGGKT
jgi:hypothetical protein